MSISVSNRTARRFQLLKQGLIGAYRFKGKQGALDFVRQAGCIQFDPVDCCGKNAELTLFSRVGGFKKSMLYSLLYRDRALFDYRDKELAILPVECWPYFARCRRAAKLHAERFPELMRYEVFTLDYIKKHGPIDSSSLPLEGETEWYSSMHWSGNWHGKAPTARSMLEQLYTSGDLVIHHKDGIRKSYDLACRHIPASLLSAPDPAEDPFSHLKWRLLRRVGAVGLLWNRRSDAFLGLGEFPVDMRAKAFSELVAEGALTEVKADGLRDTLYMRSGDMPLLTLAGSSEPLRPRCEFLAPLDPFLWDRKLIKALFGFEYSWEIYTPPEKRKYGYYVLPTVYGERFIGRLDAQAQYKSGILSVRAVFYEDGVKETPRIKKAIDSALVRLARFNGCDTVERL